MLIVVFDNGGTLINDPFPAVLREMRSIEISDSHLNRVLAPEKRQLFIDFWSEENDCFDFPLASHFIQEEVWIVRALQRYLEHSNDIEACDIPLVAPRILGLYRDLAARSVASQSQLPAMKEALEALSKQNVVVAVASNDRDFATPALLSWAGLRGFFHFVVTSEGVSAPGVVIQKPSADFFFALETIIEKEMGSPILSKIYIGDNETNDVEAPGKLGYTTVRYLNWNNPSGATWLDHRMETRADHKYDEPSMLRPLLEDIVRNDRSRAAINAGP